MNTYIKTPTIKEIVKKMNNEQIKILITGDFCPHLRVEKKLLEQQFEMVYDKFNNISEECDLTISNLECPLVKESTPIQKIGPHLKASPEVIKGIKFAGIDLVTLANNHILDYGNQGLSNTLKMCSDYDIKTVGAGNNLKEASKPKYINIKNKKIAIINIAEGEFSIATKDSPGANPLDEINNFYEINEAKQNSDFALLIFHGGQESNKYPSPNLIKRCRFFADVGANAIICHHSHVISGYETYNGVPIFYGLGNFIFDWNNRPKDWYVGMMLRLEIEFNSIKYKLIPFYQNYQKVGLQFFTEKEEVEFLKEIDKINYAIKNKKVLEKEFDNFIDSSERFYLRKLLCKNKLYSQLFNFKFFLNFINTKKLLGLLNYIKCQSHREVLIGVLDSIIYKRKK